MVVLIVIGVVLSVAGLGLLGLCMLRAWKLKRDSMGGAEAARMLESLVPLNMAGLGLGFLGIGLVAAGLILG